jgi:hypothetical protein
MEKERLVTDAVTGVHVWRVVMNCLSGFIQDVTKIQTKLTRQQRLRAISTT